MRRGILLALALAACGDPDAVPRERVTILGSANFLPGPQAASTPSLAAALIAEAGTEDWVAEPSGNGPAMQLLCRVPAALRTARAPGQADRRQPDLLLLTRAPASIERGYCADRGVEIGILKLAGYTGPPAGELSGIWLVWDRGQEARSDATARIVEVARRDAARLIRDGALAENFAPGPT